MDRERIVNGLCLISFKDYPNLYDSSNMYSMRRGCMEQIAMRFDNVGVTVAGNRLLTDVTGTVHKGTNPCVEG